MKQRKDIHQDVTNRIIAELEKGTAPWVRPWSVTQGGMPKNAISNKRYSGINIPMLWMSAASQGFDSAYWLTYKQAQKLGGNVQRGQHGTQIVYAKPMEFKRKNEKTGEDETERYMMMRGYTVFNAQQCEGLPNELDDIKPVQTYDHADRRPDIEGFLTDVGATVNHGGNRAFYRPSSDEITLPHMIQFKTAAHYYATSLHEHVHWSGAKHRLDRDIANGFGNADYAKEELVAEMGAAFLCAELGLPAELQHADYIASWIKVLKNDKRAIFKAASLATKASDYINELVATNRESIAA